MPQFCICKLYLLSRVMADPRAVPRVHVAVFTLLASHSCAWHLHWHLALRHKWARIGRQVVLILFVLLLCTRVDRPCHHCQSTGPDRLGDPSTACPQHALNLHHIIMRRTPLHIPKLHVYASRKILQRTPNSRERCAKNARAGKMGEYQRVDGRNVR